MQLNESLGYIASAGAGKTTHIVGDALAHGGRVLITTYTEENVRQIETGFYEQCGHIPSSVTILSWYRFLLQDGIRPYQNQMVKAPRVRSINYRRVVFRRRKDDYFTRNSDIYGDKVAEFAFECNARSGGMVVNRLRLMYERIYIDEFQDLAGYDLELVKALIQGGVPVTVVGDPRQGTFSTNNAGKNRQFRKSAVYDWLLARGKEGMLRIIEKSESYRCNQQICDFADALYPDFPKTTSRCEIETGHDGVFYFSANELPTYIETHRPVCLRYRRDTDTFDQPAMNIGLAKGKTFDRVVVFPTKPMLKYLKTKDLSQVGDRAKMYIAVTRARYSVAFVMSD